MSKIEYKRSAKIKVSQIVFDWENNGRAVKPNLDNLKESIRTKGQLQAVVVYEDSENASRKSEEKIYHLVAGYSRVQAIKELNEEGSGTEITVLALVSNVSEEEEILLLNIHENINRNNISPIDQAKVINLLKNKFGKSTKEIAEEFKKTPQWVRDTERFNSLDDTTKSLIHGGNIGWQSAVALCSVEPEVREETVQKLLAKVEEYNDYVKTLAPEEVSEEPEVEEVEEVSEDASDEVSELVEESSKTDEGSTSEPVSKKKKETKVDLKPKATKEKKVAPVKKFTNSEVNKEIAETAKEKGSQTVKPSVLAPKVSNIRQVFQCFLDGVESEIVKKSSEIFLEFLSGKIDSVTFERSYRKALNSCKQEK